MESFPEFYNDVQSITLYDPLAKLLGSVAEGEIKFAYKQLVKAAGHSCPTVAGAFLTCKRALEVLYPNSMPVRGEIKIEFKAALEEGVTGVVANVMTNITGASAKGGFKGLNGKYARHSLLFFEVPMELDIRLTRVDSGKSVEARYNPNVVQPSQRLQELMPKVFAGSASQEEIKEFGELWQERVKQILIDNCYNDEMIQIKKV